MQRVALREALLRRTGTHLSWNAARAWAPEAAHRFARATRCAASGARGTLSRLGVLQPARGAQQLFLMGDQLLGFLQRQIEVAVEDVVVDAFDEGPGAGR